MLKAVQSNKCILFVGSGLSVAAGYPGWKELVDKLLKEVKDIYPDRELGMETYAKSGDLLTLAEFARSKLGKHRYASVLTEVFEKPIKPHKNHEIIAKTKYRALITTNYDRLIETSFTFQRGWIPKIFTSDSIASLATALFEPSFFIYKLHGDIVSPRTIILTTQDYDRMALQSLHVRTFLQATFLNYTIFFIGYSLSDPDFQLVLKELTLIFEGYTPTHYALIPNPEEFTSEHLMERMNIRAISYNPKDEHVQMTELLSKIQEVAPYVGE